MSHEAQLTPACEGLDDDTMFPDPESSTYADDVEFAKSICAACPVVIRRQCLIFSLGNKEKHGVWGGTSEEERGRMITQIESEVERRKGGARKLVDDETVAALYAENPDPRAIASDLGVNVRTVQRAVKRTREAVAA